MADPAQLEEADKASFFGYMGLAGALVFANLGAAIGTYRSGVGICHLGILRPDKIIKSVIPVIMAGILGIYGLIVAVILNSRIKRPYAVKDGYKHFASGLFYLVLFISQIKIIFLN